MKNQNLSVIVTVFLIVLFNSIVYSALNSSMFINGDAHIRVDKDIRITDLKVLEQENGAYETYNNDYSKNTTSMQVTLPSSESFMVYEVTIINKGDIDYEVTNILEESYSNSNIKYELIDMEKGIIIAEKTSHTFKIKLTTTENNSNNKTTLVLKYTFQEIIKEWKFDYTGKEQEFIVPYDGEYKIELWGAQGGDVDNIRLGGFGGYSSGNVDLLKYDTLYINIGGQGKMIQGIQNKCNGGYNGGGSAVTSLHNSSCKASSGGGATHIAKRSGLLSILNNNIEDIYIIAGGGGGYYYDPTFNSAWSTIYVGNGGGYIGTESKCNSGSTTSLSYGGTQSSGYAFGQACGCDLGGECAGGGGGYYGGTRSTFSGGGGSGYIGNLLLKNKVMYCYKCQESTEESTRTISTTNVSEEPISNYAKKGNGYAKITFIIKK